MKKGRKYRTIKEMRDRLNNQSLRIKRASRDFFKDADIGTRRHKVKKKYPRKPKYRRNWDDEIQEGK